tara:strand:+ start:936 stop:3362 length:2427 start_codon:yes stop_codon:yes gene_type:complete
MNFIDVIIPLPLKSSFTYSVNESEFNFLNPGYRVMVPFGKSKFITGIVLRKHNEVPTSYEPKEIEFIIDDKPCITLKQLSFFSWISEYYMTPLGQVIKVALPKLLLLKSESEILLLKRDVSDINISKNSKLVFDLLMISEKLTYKDLILKFEKSTINKVLNELLTHSIITLKEEVYDYFKPKVINLISINRSICLKDLKEMLIGKRSQLIVANDLVSDKNNSKFTYNELIKLYGVSRETINKLIKSKILIKSSEIINRTQFEIEELVMPKKLSDDQNNALLEIESSFIDKNVSLLHGITSSGKTEIYVNLIEKELLKNNQVLYLVPEIALTTQLIVRLKKYFGEKLLVYHSKYSLDQRTEIWNTVLENPGKIILGARSSIFLPYNKLSLIIVDEEHENAFKQFNPAPRYNARDCAIYLGMTYSAKTLLGSATPSIESYYNAISNKYGLIKLNKRYKGIELPEIFLEDLRESTIKNKMTGSFSENLLANIKYTLEDKKQVIIFQNRRGYSPYQECESCGYVFHCKNCDVALTYHRVSDELKCHHCGYCVNDEDKCIKCSSNSLVKKGLGTQKIVEELTEYFPKYRVERMDQDSTKNKNSFFKLINDFEENKFQILVGTQMLSKGLDFKNVELVGVINADNLIYFPDFRSQEKCFQLIQQVAGRSGRYKSQGKVIVQTFNPRHSIMMKIKKNDYLGMFNEQLKERHLFDYPPYTRIIKVVLKNKSKETLRTGAIWFTKSLKTRFENKVFGPEFPLIPRIQNRYINIIQIKIPINENLLKSKKIILKIVSSFESISKFRSIQISIDVDPYN